MQKPKLTARLKRRNIQKEQNFNQKFCPSNGENVVNQPENLRGQKDRQSL